VLRAVVLFQSAQGGSAPRIGRMLALTPPAIGKVGHPYQQGGLARALYEPLPPGTAEVLGHS